MSGDHTVKSYGADLAKIDTLVITIMTKTEEQVSKAVEAMSKGDRDLAAVVEETDSEINALEQELQELCVKALALREPKGRDLRKVVAATRIAVDVERVADYAANVAKKVPALNSSLPQEIISDVIRMGRSVQAMISGLSKAYETDDPDLAIKIWRMDDEIDEVFANILAQSLPQMKIDDQDKKLEIYSMALVVVKSVERMGDHLTNVAEHTYYAIEGVQLFSVVDKKD